MSDNHVIHDAEGKELNARFSAEHDGSRLSVVIASSGGGASPSNLDYDEALQLILQRLASVNAELSHVEVDSKQSANLPQKERMIVLDGYPFLLSAVDDLKDLRRKICRGAQKTARRPGATGGGNPRKRLRLFLGFKKSPPPGVDDLVQLIGHGSEIAHGREVVYGREVEQQSRMIEFAADDSTLSSWGTRTRKGQGFEREQAVRQAVEERAMVAAEQHYAAAQWTTERREHDNVGYDILCTKGTERLFVEVKGTRGDGSQVIITKKEAAHAHEYSKQTELFILYQIELDNIEASGKVRIISEWDPIASGSLTPITYFWHIPDEWL
jgi:hypothetical protein